LSTVMLLLGSLSLNAQQIEYIDVTSKKWEFRNTKDENWLSANVPSTFHLDLIDHQLVTDPYNRDNLLQFYKYEFDDWEYRTTFEVTK
jgi:beta-mannosidase